MPRMKGTTGSGMTKKGVLQFDANVPTDMDAMMAAAIRTFEQTSYSRVSRTLRSHAEAILAEHNFPSNTEVRYAFGDTDPAEREKSSENKPFELWELPARLGISEDSPPGYSVRLLYVLKEIDSLSRQNSHDEALALAIQAGQLVAEAGIKEIWEKDALRGLKSMESSRKGHIAVHGSAEEKKKRRAAQLAAFERQRAQGRGIVAAYKAAAKECGVSIRTIRRSVTQK